MATIDEFHMHLALNVEKGHIAALIAWSSTAVYDNSFAYNGEVGMICIEWVGRSACTIKWSRDWF